MKAGRLRHRVTLQSPYGSRDAVGERVTMWTDRASDVPAEVRPLSGREQYIFAQKQASTTHIVTLRWGRYLADLDASWRVQFKDRVFTIDAPPKNLDERNIEVDLECTEGLSVE